MLFWSFRHARLSRCKEAQKSCAEDPEEEELPASECTRHRAIAARGNYLLPDRPDIQYAVKECCRMMSRPTARSWEMLKRIGKYLKGKARLIRRS